MWMDVQDLATFYQSPLGRVTGKVLRQQIQAIWPLTREERILGVGYTLPFLHPFQQQAETVVAAMPHTLGCTPWPHGSPNAVTLVDEFGLPFPDRAFDKVLVMHALEFSEHIDLLLRECWRVLTYGGHLLVCVPNRRSIWSQMEETPFGHGQPFSYRQLKFRLEKSCLTILQTKHCLFFPPARFRFMLNMAPYWEQWGRKWLWGFSGGILIEAHKDAYATHGPTEVERTYRSRLFKPSYTPHPSNSEFVKESKVI